MPTLVLVSQFARFTPKSTYLLHCKSVTTCPKGTVTTCPSVISITKFVIVEKYGVPTSSDLYVRYSGVARIFLWGGGVLFTSKRNVLILYRMSTQREVVEGQTGSHRAKRANFGRGVRGSSPEKFEKPILQMVQSTLFLSIICEYN